MVPLDLVVFNTSHILLHTNNSLSTVLFAEKDGFSWNIGQNEEGRNTPSHGRTTKDGKNGLQHMQF